MAAYHVVPLEVLLEQFEKLPGIGYKTAQRLAYYMLRAPKEEAEAFCKAILEAREKVHYCKICCNLTDQEICPVCQSDSRDKSVICVVEDPKDVMAFERLQEYRGLYHVLHGLISPLNGIGPESIRIKELLQRLQSGDVREIIMATNPTIEGEATAMYLSKLLKPLGFKVSRLAFGIPIGGELEYADNVTLNRALENRTEL